MWGLPVKQRPSRQAAMEAFPSYVMANFRKPFYGAAIFVALVMILIFGVKAMSLDVTYYEYYDLVGTILLSMPVGAVAAAALALLIVYMRWRNRDDEKETPESH